MHAEIRNVGASVRARLQNLSRETGQSFELILTRDALERLLYRLSTSALSDRFVLKGAMLLTSRFTDLHRATRELVADLRVLDFLDREHLRVFYTPKDTTRKCAKAGDGVILGDSLLPNVFAWFR